MNKRINYLLWACLGLLGWVGELSAQVTLPQSQYVFDVLYLKDSTVISGWITEQKVGEYVKIQLVGGSLLVIEQERIDQITRERSPYQKIVRRANAFQKPLQFRPQGVYHMLDLHFGLPEGEWGNPSLNPALHYRVGYHWNRWLATGVGTGLDLLSAGLVIPVFGEVQGYLWDKPSTPFYSVQGGYGLGVAPVNWLVEDIGGGLFYQVSMGVKVHTRDRHQWFFSLGWKSQTLDITRQDGWDWRTGELIPGLQIVRPYQTLVLQCGVRL